MVEKVQRRLAAIVAADVVGYSRLMGRDEAGTLARLKALRREIVHPAVTKHGGVIVGTAGSSNFRAPSKRSSSRPPCSARSPNKATIVRFSSGSASTSATSSSRRMATSTAMG
jgi:class 3 adenylate cyclase